MSITQNYLKDKTISNSIIDKFKDDEIYSIKSITKNVNDGFDDIFERKISEKKCLEIFKQLFENRFEEIKTPFKFNPGSGGVSSLSSGKVEYKILPRDYKIDSL